MTEEILFILHVVNGIDIIIHNVIGYNYTTTYKKISINILILVQTPFTSHIQIRIIIIVFILVQISISSLTIPEVLSLNSIFQNPYNDI